MALGYEGLATITFDGTEERVLCTSASVPKGRVRLESSSGYGGKIKTPVNEMGISYPRVYDWNMYEGSVGFETNEDVITDIIKPWIFDRQNFGTVNLSSRSGNSQLFNSCFWNNITISASQGAFVETSMSFVAINRNDYDIGGGYIDDKTGQGGFCNPALTYEYAPPLNPCNENKNPVPFWNTTVSIDSVQTQFLNWQVNLSQEVVKFFSCEDNSNPVEPKFLSVGPLVITFTGDYMFLGDPSLTGGFVMPDDVNTIDIGIAGESLGLRELELTNDTDAVQSPDALTPIAVDYNVYELAV